MSDAGVADSTVGPQVPTSVTELTAGAMMRHAREASGLHVAALAVSMKIPVKKLEALEADRLDLLHDAVFVRALAASVCRALKIDPAPVLDKLPLKTVPKLRSAELGINAPFRSLSYSKGTSLPEVLKKRSTLAFLALILAGVVVFFLPNARVPDLSGVITTEVNVASDSVSPSLVTQPSTPMSGTSLEPAANNLGALQTAIDVAAVRPKEGASNTEIGMPSAPVIVASQAATIASPWLNVVNNSSQASNLPMVAPSSPTTVAPIPSTGTVVFKAKGATWVQVVDAKGSLQLSKTLIAGEVVGASGAMPLSVVIGRVDATDVEVRGQSFNLSVVSRDNVARFEVK